MPHSLSHPEYMTITSPEGETYRGGNQAWYQDVWQRRAGCGPTTAATLLAYLSETSSDLLPLAPTERGTQGGFLRYMEDVWSYVTPGAKGLDKPESMVVGCRSFALSRGCRLQGEVLKIPARWEDRPSLVRCRDFIAQALDDDRPIAFLNYSNGALQNLDSWHWVPLISVALGEAPPEGDEVLLCSVLDEGEERIIDLALWLETTLLGGALVDLYPEPTFFEESV